MTKEIDVDFILSKIANTKLSLNRLRELTNRPSLHCYFNQIDNDISDIIEFLNEMNSPSLE